MSDFTVVGRLFKPHGVKGELKGDIENEYLEDVLSKGLVYVQEGNNEIPYFIESIRSQNPFLIKLETIDNKEDAVRVAHREVKVMTNTLSKIIVEVSDLEYHYLVGYTMIDADHGEIGVISKLEEYPQQEMAFVEKAEQEFLIPLHTQVIERIDKEARKIYMDLPDGLLNMEEEE